MGLVDTLGFTPVCTAVYVSRTKCYQLIFYITNFPGEGQFWGVRGCGMGIFLVGQSQQPTIGFSNYSWVKF